MKLLIVVLLSLLSLSCYSNDNFAMNMDYEVITSEFKDNEKGLMYSPLCPMYNELIIKLQKNRKKIHCMKSRGNSNTVSKNTELMIDSTVSTIDEVERDMKLSMDTVGF